MVSFAREVRRLAPSYFVQTPNFWFPIEPHWMVPVFIGFRAGTGPVVHCASAGHAKRSETVDERPPRRACRLLDRRMFRYLFPTASTSPSASWMPKSLIAVREEGAR